MTVTGSSGETTDGDDGRDDPPSIDDPGGIGIDPDAPSRPPERLLPLGKPSVPPFQRAGGPHLWEVNVVRDLFLLGLLFGAIWLLVTLQAVVVPFVIAFVLAYLADPLVTAARVRFGWPRALTSGLLLAVLLALLAVVAGLLVPTLEDEVRRLVANGPAYLEVLRERYGDWLPGPPGFLDSGSGAAVDGSGSNGAGLSRSSNEGGRGDVETYVRVLGEAFEVVRGFLGVTGYLLVATVLTLAAFVLLSIRFPRLPSLRPYLPRSRREELWQLLRAIERVFAGFFRGQLVVAAFTTTVFAIGFALSGVPYWFLVSLIGGAFSIIPYGQMSGFVLAVGAKLLEHQASGSDFTAGGVWLDALLGPAIVYALMQSLETFLVTPWVQGSQVRMHPLLVFASVVAGGSVGGLLGVFLAIPIAASAKILLGEVVLPRLRALAEQS